MESVWKIFRAQILQRWLFALMGCLAIINAFAMRNCLSLTITAMVTQTNTSSNDTRSDVTCPVSKSTSLGSLSNEGDTFEWDEYTQGIILSSFYWGYMTTQLLGGISTTKLGGKYVLGLGILSIAILTLLTPLVVQVYDATGLIILRILMGLSEGITFPALFALTAQWSPLNEKLKITMIIFTGSQWGTILGTSLSGVLIEYFSGQWSIVFYVFGALGILWFFTWTAFCYSYPDVHAFISGKEKEYLYHVMNEQAHKETQPTPWRHMLMSVPLWALIIGKLGHEWGFQCMTNDLPKYLSNVLKISIPVNGFLTAIPNAAMWAVGIGSPLLADWLIKSKRISRTRVRKTFTTISSIGPAAFMMAASYAKCNQTIASILITVSMGMMGLSYSGIIVNPFDLSPNHSEALIAILTVLSSLCGILAPYTIGLLTPNQALFEWEVAFSITFVICCITNLIFNLWADGTVQYWNDMNSNAKKQKERKPKERVLFIMTNDY